MLGFERRPFDIQSYALAINILSFVDVHEQADFWRGGAVSQSPAFPLPHSSVLKGENRQMKWLLEQTMHEY